VDLPGTYYLEAVERMFKENELAKGKFVALGRLLDLAAVRIPIYLLAARDDELVAPQQLLAAEYLVGSRSSDVTKSVLPGRHLSLFMGREVLAQTWPQIAHWLNEPVAGEAQPIRTAA
jgi:poly(3-hydroxyalkanoate) synthetase